MRVAFLGKLAVCFVLLAVLAASPVISAPADATQPHTGIMRFMAAAPAHAAVSIRRQQIVPSQTPTSQVKAAEQRAFELLNADRRANGLPPLKLNGTLVVLAENYGLDMIQRDYFSHYNPEGLSPFDRMRSYGVNYRYAGENLAINRTVDAAQRALMNSPGHRANILNPNYTEVGIGITYNNKGAVYVVQEFIGR